MEEDLNPSILIIYTGGTIGMAHDPESGILQPVDFNQIAREVPELKRFGYRISAITFDPVMDSSNLDPGFWVRLAGLIEKHYDDYQGFVILHGTDTMAYSASAMSFMLENLSKPVIFTGSQLPIGTLRTDGKENLITAVEIAAARYHHEAMVPEVCIYFENTLFRGNRTRKYNAEHFNAFRSDNYPHLAEAGVHIRYHYGVIHYPTLNKAFRVHTKMDTGVAILKIFPGITEAVVDAILHIPGLKALVMETFGAGNAPSAGWFVGRLEKAIRKGLVVLNVTQCHAGRVEMGRYETSQRLVEAGVVGGYDITTEAALTKLMFLLGQGLTNEEIKFCLNKPLRGEIST